MNFICWIAEKKNTPNPPKMQKSSIFKWKNLEKFKIKKIFLIEAEFTIQVEHTSQNMPKCL